MGQARHWRADVEQQRAHAGAVARPALQAPPVAERQREAVSAHMLILRPTLRYHSAPMSSDRVTLEVTERGADQLGSRNVRRLRKEGLIPGVIYGKGHTRAIVVGERDLRAALTGPSGLHAILDVVIEGQKTPHHAVLKEYQQHPIRGTLTHVDFHEVRLDQPIQATRRRCSSSASRPARRSAASSSRSPASCASKPCRPAIPEHIEADISGARGR